MQVKHKMPPRRSQDAQKTGQEAPRHPKTHPGRTRNAPGRFQDGPRCPKTSPRRPKAPPDFDFGALAPGFLKLAGAPDPTLDSLKLDFGWFYDFWPTACQITYGSLLSSSHLPTLPPAAPTCMTTTQKLMPQISIALWCLHSLSDTAINYFIT